MKVKYIIVLLLQALSLCVAAQNLGMERAGTLRTYIYRIPAAVAQQVLNKQVLNPNDILQNACVDSFYTDSTYTGNLHPGHYLYIKGEGTQLTFNYKNITTVATTALSDYNGIKFTVLQQGTGMPITNATVQVGKRSYSYDTALQAYNIRTHGKAAWVTVATPADTTFYNLTFKQHRYLANNIRSRFRYFYYRLKNAFQQAFIPKTRTYSGYSALSKPKYFPVDTVKVKAFITKANGKPLNMPLVVKVQRADYSWRTIYDTLRPLTPGAYVFNFALSDSFAPDHYYAISFETRKKKEVLSTGFKVEDYLLNVNGYTASADKKDYNLRDTLVVDINGHDFNGLPVMDAAVQLTALTEDASSYAANRVFIPDTIFNITAALNADGNFKYPYIFGNPPKASFKIRLNAHLTNGNNEVWDTSFVINYNYAAYKLITAQVNDSIKTSYYVNGMPATGTGNVVIYKSNNEVLSMQRVSLPCVLPLNPAAIAYRFQADSGQASSYTYIEPLYNWQATAFHADSEAVFIISNKNNVPFYFTIFRNSKVFEQGYTHSLFKIIPDLTDAVFTLSIQYQLRDQTFTSTYRAAIMKTQLQIDVTNAAQVYPGQRDTFKVAVKTVNGKPVKNVNLTAYSANAQFGAELSAPTLPGLYRRGHLCLHQYQPTLSAPGYNSSFALCCVPAWQQRLRLDSMAYYRFIYPKTWCNYYYDSLPYSTPQLAVYVYRCGQQVKIYNVHVDGQLVYTAENQLSTPYSYDVRSNNPHLVTFRLDDREFAFSDVKLYPGYKLEISYNYDSLLRILPKPNCKPQYTNKELSELRQHTIAYKTSVDDYYGYGVLWQNNRVFVTPPRQSSQNLVVGPVVNDSMKFCRIGKFILSFIPENSYAYSFSSTISRLEKYDPFNRAALKKPYKLKGSAFENLPLGQIALYPKIETIAPVVPYRPKYMFDYLSYGKKSGYGVLEINPATDSTFEWAQLTGGDSLFSCFVNGVTRTFFPLPPGVYNILLATEHGNYVYFDSLYIKPDGLNYAALKPCAFAKLPMLNLVGYADKAYRITGYAQQFIDTNVFAKNCIAGRVSVNDSQPARYATVHLKQNGKTISATQADVNGNFIFITKGTGVFTVTATGKEYDMNEVTGVPAGSDSVTIVHIKLRAVAGNTLGEVDITTDKVTKHIAEETVSMEVISAMPGVAYANGEFNSLERFTLRGSRSIKEVQIVSYKKALRTTDANGIAAAPEASAEPNTITGADELLNKYAGAKTLRNNFKDEGFWQPNLVTDKTGHASFAVQYPDNLTSWKTFVIGMDAHRRNGMAVKTVRSFKDVSATLATPGFLIEGDSANLVAEAYNYTHTPLNFNAAYSINNQPVFNRSILVSSATDLKLPIVAPPFKGPADTITAAYTIALSNGFSDGEERKIPILQRSTMETKGMFAVLNTDTAFNYLPDTTASVTTLHAEGDLLPVLLDEIKHLKEYPYWCVEQTASRLVALTMEQKIDSVLGIKFKGSNEKKNVIKKLLAMQQFDGGFGWWQNSGHDMYITSYVLTALYTANNTGDYTIANATTNAENFLKQSLPYTSKDEKLNILEALAGNRELKDFLAPLLKQIPFDSLTLQQQLRLVKTQLICGTSNNQQWNKILQHQQQTVFGGAYFGEETYCFYNNTISATLTAYDVATLQNNTTLQQQIITYLLTTRTQNGWRNTYESARILSTILPLVISQRGGNLQPATLNINGNETKLPYTGAYTGTQPVHISKQGHAPVYLTAYQKSFNRNPAPVAGLYKVQTAFMLNNQPVDTLKGGQITQLQVTINATQYAEYISIEIPIPAGCTYNSKEPQSWYNNEVHREYYKNKVLIFCRNLSPGTHTFTLPLQPRYTGTYTLNPTRVELMYFPTMFGRNGIRKVRIGE